MAALLQPFGPRLWLADGPLAQVAGFSYPTRMAVIQLAEGLLIWSPVSLTEGLRRELAELGEVRWLVAPNSLHHLFLAEWREAYPGAEMIAAPGLAARRPDLDIDRELGGGLPAEWAGEIDLVLMAGNRITTEAVFFHRASSTVLFTDLVQQFPKGWFRGWRALVARLDQMTEPEPSVPRKFRMAFTDRRAAREALARILVWPCLRVVMAHGRPIEQDGQAFIARAFRWLAAR